MYGVYCESPQTVVAHASFFGGVLTGDTVGAPGAERILVSDNTASSLFSQNKKDKKNLSAVFLTK